MGRLCSAASASSPCVISMQPSPSSAITVLAGCTNCAAFGFGALQSNLASGSNNTALGDSAGFNSNGNRNVFLGNLAGYYETSSNKLYLASDSNNTIMYGDFLTGQVLMGMGQPTGYTFKGTRTLNVLGGIIADSVRVALSSAWADYVFADEYKLMPLEELSRFIKTNKHLPNIPTAAEVEKNGIELGAMNAKLLEKIEELYLYILQQQNENSQQQKQIDEQNKSRKLLQNQMDEQNKINEKLQKQIDELKQTKTRSK